MNRQEYNNRMTTYYDSISIDENFTGLNYQLFQTEKDAVSTVSTNLSTPVSARKDTSELLKTTSPTTPFKISNGRLPLVQYRSSFSLEDTMKTLKDMDEQDNISQIRNSYKYYGNPNYDSEGDVDSGTESNTSPKLQINGPQDLEHTTVFTSYSVLDLNNSELREEVTHL